MESEVNAFDVDPMRKSVSGVLARLPATSAMPTPATHSGPSLCTIATETPGVCVSLRIFSSCCCSSGMDVAGLGFSSGLSAAREKEAKSPRIRTETKRFTAGPPHRTQHLTLRSLYLVVEIVHDSLQRGVDGLGYRFGAFEALDTIAQLVNFGCDRGEGFREGIVDLLGIGDHDTLAFAEDDVAWHADDSGVVGDVAENDGSGADTAVLANGDVAENLRASADNHAVFESGMALAVFLAGAAESDALVESDVVADDCRFANHD